MPRAGCADCRCYCDENYAVNRHAANPKMRIMEKGKRKIMAYIKVENLKYRYPNTTKLALDGLDFEIEKGSFIGLSERMELERVRSVRRSTVLFRDFSKGLTEEKF